MSFFKDLFKSKEQKLEEARLAELELQSKINEAVNKRIQDKIQEEQDLERAKQEHVAKLLEEKMNSDTPWFEPIINASPDAPLSERFNWNNAFIASLTKKGFKGNSPEDIFQAYLDEQDAAEKRRLIEEEREIKRKSSEPWVEVIGEKINDDGQIELQLDWNAPFVKYLRLNGFRGATDDIIVQQWLVSLDRVLDNPETYQ